MKAILAVCFIAFVFATAMPAAEYHVAVSGNDGNPGTGAQPFRTIQHAADIAQPGDVITVHAGTYRERINPPRGGESDTRRIVYQGASGENVVITGSEIIKGWQKVAGDTWKVVIPSKYFGGFNPYGDLIRGDWFSPEGRPHHTGAVYLDGDWLTEAATMDGVLAPVGPTPLWYATVDGASSGNFLVNLAWLKPGIGAAVPSAQPSAKHGGQAAPCTEGGQCIGFIHAGDWLRYDNVDFGAGTNDVELRVASKTDASHVELRLDNADGPLLGAADVIPTGDWQRWVSVHAPIQRTSGRRTVCVVFKSPPAKTDNTTIWAQFKGVDPNAANVEINVRKTVFTPEATGINYITMRGFTLRDAATNWAPPTAGQIGLVTAYWCKGWIIEDNDIAYSTCSGVSLGKYGDEFDNTSADSAEGYVGTLNRALKNGWNKETVGSHIVRNNVISHCEQTGVVGSLGCSYSTVSGNVIHDIHIRQLFGGEEMAGIKFHGAIDVTISHNHIYRCGNIAGIWLDWMAQGAHITGNLMHDNIGEFGDIFLEMQHGPILIANNILLSHRIGLNAQGVAFAHNLILGSITNMRGDGRSTPYQVAHSTEVAGLYPAPKGDSGDDRAYNNIIVAPCSLNALDNSALPCFAGGNVFTKGAAPSKLDTDALVAPAFDPGVKLSQAAGSWYLEINLDNAWSAQRTRKLVTTELLGNAHVSGEAFEDADGTPIRIDTDYFGRKRNEQNPAPGPFENPGGGNLKLKVW